MVSGLPRSISTSPGSTSISMTAAGAFFTTAASVFAERGRSMTQAVMMNRSAPARCSARKPDSRGRGTRSSQWSRSAEASESMTSRFWRKVSVPDAGSGFWSSAANNAVWRAGCLCSIPSRSSRGSPMPRRLQMKTPTVARTRSQQEPAGNVRPRRRISKSTRPAKNPDHQVIARPPCNRWRWRRAAISPRMACSFRIMWWRGLDVWRRERFLREKIRRRRSATTSRRAGGFPVGIGKLLRDLRGAGEVFRWIERQTERAQF